MDFINEKLSKHFIKNPRDIVVMDNCRFHHRKDVLDLLTDRGIGHRFLPPYSPQLNPIEEYFSSLKSRISSFMTTMISRDDIVFMIEDLLLQEDSDFTGWFRHMRKYVDKALAKQHFI